MILEEEAHSVAVNLKKSENMKVTAGRVLAAMWAYIQDPSTDGAQQLINAGLPVTQRGLWEAVKADRDFPGEIIGRSFRQCEKLLAIGRAEDPEEELQKQQASQEAANAKIRSSVTKPAFEYGECNNVRAFQPATLEALKGAVKDLSSDDFTAFKKWFREFCGA